jgi:hypothetical protein
MLMPSHRCSACHRLVVGRCPRCTRTRQAAFDTRRPNANARGYCSARWRRFRALQLQRQPLCVACEKEGRITMATDVDHIRPVTGPDDESFLRFSAVQSFCAAHHSQKTAREDSTFANRR